MLSKENLNFRNYILSHFEMILISINIVVKSPSITSNIRHVYKLLVMCQAQLATTNCTCTCINALWDESKMHLAM